MPLRIVAVSATNRPRVDEVVEPGAARRVSEQPARHVTAQFQLNRSGPA